MEDSIMRKTLDPDMRISAEEGRTRHELIAGGKAVSRLFVNELNVRVGICTIRVGGIGDVFTEPEHRNKGFSRRCLENSNAWMRTNNFDMSMLYGIRNFYPKFGYVPAFPIIACYVATRHAERASGEVPSREVKCEEDLEAIRLIYERGNSALTGTVVRSKGAWKGFRHGSAWEVKSRQILFHRSDGYPVAYMALDNSAESVLVHEAGVVEPSGEVLGAMLRAAAADAVTKRIETIVFHMPESHPLVRFCIPFGMRIEKRFRNDGGGMVRTANAVSTLQKILPEINTRLTECRSDPWTGPVAIEAGCDLAVLIRKEGRLELIKGGGKAARARMGQGGFAQLVFGYRDIDDLIRTGEAECDPDALPALRAMFPVREHYQWDADHF